MTQAAQPVCQNISQVSRLSQDKGIPRLESVHNLSGISHGISICSLLRYAKWSTDGAGVTAAFNRGNSGPAYHRLPPASVTASPRRRDLPVAHSPAQAED